MGFLGRWGAVFVALIAATGCAPETSSESAFDTAISTSEDQNAAPVALDSDPGLQDLSLSARLESLRLLAGDIEADPVCVANQFTEVATADLERVGIRDTGIAEGMWDEVIANAESPVLNPLMLTVSLCTGFFEELVYEDLSDELQPDELDCVVLNGRNDPGIVALHMAGTRDGATLEEAYSAAMVTKLQQGLVAEYEIVTAMRTLGECPDNDPT